VFTVSLANERGRIQCVANIAIDNSSFSNNCLLIGLGSLRGYHDIWLFNESELMVWRGEERTFVESGFIPTGLGRVMAVSAIRVQGE
ncbi:hypothetical protein PFISCL1PPCAC_20891, partial [Pristionchus fissidentatus]